MKKRYAYVALLSYADDGISIEFPDLPGCLPCAQTTEEAIDNAKEALGLHLWGMEQDQGGNPGADADQQHQDQRRNGGCHDRCIYAAGARAGEQPLCQKRRFPSRRGFPRWPIGTV